MKKKVVIALIVCSLATGAAGIAWTVSPDAEESDRPSLEGMEEVVAGRFLMGSEIHSFDERPVHEVVLSSFWMDRNEVTYKEYRAFLMENPAWEKGKVDVDLADLDYLRDWEGTTYPAGKENHPVVYVSWFAAVAYAEWAGKELPSEAQWEYAGRGGLRHADYPWGDLFNPTLVRWKGSVPKGAGRVGSYSINGFRLNDMSGNVSEWTADGYGLYQDDLQYDPTYGMNNHFKVARGGSWRSEAEELFVSSRRRHSPNRCVDDLGFRCCYRLSS